MKNVCRLLVLSSVLFLGTAKADIVFNGFASVVAGVTTSSDETLYGYDDSIDFSNGSLFAIQASSDLGEGLSVTAQILARGEDDWSTNFEWAYVAYDVNDNLRILAGRQRVPFYMFSDFLDVSYAYAWISPPAGVYSVAFDTFDGLGALYNGSIGEFDTTLHVIYGGNNSEITVAGEDVTPDFNDLVGASFTVNREWLTLRAAYVQTEMNIDVQATQPLATGWKLAGFEDVANNILVSEDTGSFMEVGFQLDFEKFIVIGEYTQLTLDGTTLGDQDSLYVMAGYRFSNMLAHITYGIEDNSKDRITGGVPTGVAPALDGLIAVTNGITDGETLEADYITLGLRWDFHDSAALKFEFTSYGDDLNSNNDAGLFRTAIVTVF